MFFVGERTQPKFYNEHLYRDGEGLFPVPLLRDAQLLVDRLQKGADIEPLDKGILSVFAGETQQLPGGRHGRTIYADSQELVPGPGFGR